MNRPNKSPLTPDSLQADGIKGLGARDGQATSGAKHIPANVKALCLLLGVAIEGARRVCARIQAATDAPHDGAAEAADHLDAAADYLGAILAGGGDHDPA